MIKLGIIGYPLGHSISAAIQKAGLKSLGIEATYDVMETSPEDLIAQIKHIKYNDYLGFNVTIPHKVPITLFLDGFDKYANIAGCVNTIKIQKDRSFFGYNTDIYGFKTAIPQDINLNNKTASILGTGGAARAAAVGLIEKGIAKINFYSRNVLNSNDTLDYLSKSFPDIIFDSYQIQTLKNLNHSSIIVNATPIGMNGYMGDLSPLEEEELSLLNKETIIYDIVYNPIKTKLLRDANNQGLRTITGLDMLLYQAEKAIEIWTGLKPNILEMKIAALETLN